MSDEPQKKRESALHVERGVSVDPNRKLKPRKKRRSLSVEDHVKGVLEGDRAILGRTFSLMESRNAEHRQKANEVLEKLLPHTGKSVRLGITGVPGVGKSTFIDVFGSNLTKNDHRVAVLTVDPSSEVSGGSILGDKTRMESLAMDPKAMVRPSAAGGGLGGVARGTRESILVCEAAGFDVVIVETVGVGQSETQVASMVDFFLLLMLAGAGDELQGIKRGIIELADLIAINKADGENLNRSKAAKAEYQSALRLLTSPTEGWQPKVTICSALTGMGIEGIWDLITDHRSYLEETGRLEEKRDEQALFWLQQTLEIMLVERFYRHPEVEKNIDNSRRDVVEGRASPFTAAERLLALAGYQAGTAGKREAEED